MNGVRINTAYGDIEQYELIVENTRRVADIPIILDIKGPEIRLRVKQEKIVKKGDVVDVGFKNEEISFNHNFYDKVAVSTTIYIDNGKVRTQIVEKSNGKLRLSILNGGQISDGKGVNIPNKQLAVPTLSKKDVETLKFAAKYGIEYLALSYTRGAQDVHALKSIGHHFDGAIIAKIENSEGLTNFEKILDAAEGIMVARGDLGVEIEPEKVPLVQKSIIRLCNQKGKTVITATDMLESMISQPVPTRAEVSDVANAILDGTDAVMLSGETSVGEYPVEAVRMMSRVARETETMVKSSVEEAKFINISDTVSRAIQRLCQSMPVDKVVTLTRSGYTANMIARFKVQPPIIAITPDEKVRRQLELVFGVCPVHIDYRKEEDRTLYVTRKLRSLEMIRDKDIVLFTAASRTAKRHASNVIEIHKVEELLNTT